MRRGLTLIEIVVVLAILGIIAAVAAPAFANVARADALRDGSASVVRTLERARATAHAYGHRVVITIDPQSARFWIDEPSLTGVIQLPGDARLWSDRARVHVAFDASGPATADLLAVQANGRTAGITVDRFTGEVTSSAR